MENTINVKGHIEYKIIRNGKVIKQWENHNLITSAGKALLASLAGDAAAVPFTFLALGTSTTAPAVGQTALQAEITDTGLARAAATVSRVTTNVTNDTLQLVYTWTASGSKTVEEIGMFNDASAGTMLGRALTGTSALILNDTFIATYKVTFS